MPRWLNLSLQLFASLLQTLSAMCMISGLVGPKLAIANLLIAWAQGAISIVAHSYNTDGTPQSVAFQPATTDLKAKSQNAGGA